MTATQVETQLELIAHHEAGHAVAAALRGAFDISVTLRGEGNLALTSYRHRPISSDLGFIAYAGPWSEAMYEWTNRHPSEPDGFDDEDEFYDYLGAAFIMNDHDAQKFIRSFEYLQLSDLDPAREREVRDNIKEQWHREMLWLWPVVVKVARMLLVDESSVTTEVVKSLLSQEWE